MNQVFLGGGKRATMRTDWKCDFEAFQGPVFIVCQTQTEEFL